MENTEEKKVLKASRFEIEQQLNQYVGSLKVEGLTSKAKLALVKLKIEMSKVVEDINDFRKKTLESIDKPENYDELKSAAEKEEATKEDKEAWSKVEKEYNEKFAEVALPYFNEVVELPFDFLTEEDFYTLVEHNDVNVVFGYEYVYNKLVKKPNVNQN